MKKLAGVLAAFTFGSAMAATPAKSPTQDFNPVKDFLVAHHLFEAAKREPKPNAVCQINSGTLNYMRETEREKLAGLKPLMSTFYFCAAVGHPAYKDNPFNDAVRNPPAGKTADDVKREIAETIRQSDMTMCEDMKADETRTFFIDLCKARQHPAYINR